MADAFLLSPAAVNINRTNILWIKGCGYGNRWKTLTFGEGRRRVINLMSTGGSVWQQRENHDE